MKMGLKKEVEGIKQYRKSQELQEEINEMMVKMTFKKQMEDALKKR